MDAQIIVLKALFELLYLYFFPIHLEIKNSVELLQNSYTFI